MYLSQKDIKAADRIKRLNMINSITGIKSANLIGTISNSGVSNLAIFSSVVHLGSDPGLLGFILRPAHTVRRHTYENIIANGCFTINHVHEEFTDRAHYTSAKFDQDESEFTYCKLKEEFLSDFLAPFVKESKLKIGLNLVETIKIKSNKCLLLIGSIEHLFVPDEIINDDGYINIASINTVGVNGLNTYYKLNKLVEHPYVRYSDVEKYI